MNARNVPGAAACCDERICPKTYETFACTAGAADKRRVGEAVAISADLASRAHTAISAAAIFTALLAITCGEAAEPFLQSRGNQCEDGICEIPPECDCQCVFDCFDSCEEGDQACAQGCADNGPPFWGYPELVTCLDQSGYFECAEDDQECLTAAFEICVNETSYPARDQEG